ncbi:CoxG family protein [Symbiobacterium terraclitae]|uniref:CoxG family protein n=1 Tax=Symbiobacterium terraclitae TaxID=557451 RepID=UPI0035B517D7
MRISGSFGFEAPPDVVYRLFTDPDALMHATVGLRALRPMGPDLWEAEMKVRLGGFTLAYRGTIAVTDRTSEGYRLRIAAQTEGGAIDADVALCFLPFGTGTRVEYAAEFAIHGAQRLQPALARALIDFFMHGMKEYAARCRQRSGHAAAPHTRPQTDEHTPE